MSTRRGPVKRTALSLLVMVTAVRPARAEEPSPVRLEEPASATSKDPDTPDATLEETKPVTVPARYWIEHIDVIGNKKTRTTVVRQFVPFAVGDTLDANDVRLESARYRLLGTGFFSKVDLSLRKGSQRGWVRLVVRVEERNTIILNDLWLGLASDVSPDGEPRPITAYGGAHVSEMNLLGTGIALSGAFIIADRQFGVRAGFTNPHLFGSHWIAESEVWGMRARDFFGNRDVLVDDPREKTGQDYASPRYSRVGGSMTVGHDLGVSTQLFAGYRLERIEADLPLAASHVYGLEVQPLDFYLEREISYLSALRASFVFDTRDDTALPTQGQHLVAQVDTGLNAIGSSYSYAKLIARFSHYWHLPWNHVLRLEAFVGSIAGRAPLFERFYVGDLTDFLPDRVLDLTFDRRPPPNFLHTSIVEQRYGDHAARLQLEYRMPVHRGRKFIYGADLFFTLGVYGVAQQSDFTRGITGYRGFNSVPLDLNFNAGVRISSLAGNLQLGIANVLSFLPVRGPEEGAQR